MSDTMTFPTTAGLHAALRHYRGCRAYVIEIRDESGRPYGNNGDILMDRVFRLILEELEIEQTLEPDLADLAIVPPSGALLQGYAFPGLLPERARTFNSRPLVVFPSSLYFPTQDPAFMFQGRTAPTTLILREAQSHRHLLSLWADSLQDAGVNMVIDHDVVASGHEYVKQEIGDWSMADYVLVSARRDRESTPIGLESPSGIPARKQFRDALASAIPYGSVKTALARVARSSANQRAAEELIESVERDRLSVLQPGAKQPSMRMVDASATQFATFVEYRKLVGRASAVITNRLHVALPSAILGKQVILVETGYHKLRGVYEQSLSGAPNVLLVDHFSSGGQ